MKIDIGMAVQVEFINSFAQPGGKTDPGAIWALSSGGTAT